MVSAYKAMRAGIMMPTLAADPPQIQIGRNDN
jgi:hypothetical protein